MKLIRPAILLVLILAGAITLAVYPGMPATITSHWNAAGEADGTMPKLPGLALIPLLMLGFSLLFLVLPRFDPLKENYRKFQDYYDGFILVFALFLFVIQMQVILWARGIFISPTLLLPVLMGGFFMYLGVLLEHAEPNWFVGIRTPWTMSSPSVWRKTHQLGGKLFMLAGAVSIAGILAGAYAILFILIPVIAVSVVTVVYSYREFKKEQASGTGE